MKNISALIIVMLLIVACNPTRNELRVSKRTDKKFINAHDSNNAQSELYASTDKFIVINNNFYDSLQRKGDQVQAEIAKDNAASFKNLKKSMTVKVYSTAIDTKTSAKNVEKDTVYLVKDNGWYVVE